MSWLLAALCVGGSVGCLWFLLPRRPSRRAQMSHHLAHINRDALNESRDLGGARSEDVYRVDGLEAFVLDALMRYAREQPDRMKFVPVSSRRDARIAACIEGCSVSDRISVTACKNFQVICGFLGGVVCGCLGFLLSDSLAVLLGGVGFCLGFRLPVRMLLRIQKARCARIERESAGVFEMMSLMLVSGISFDRAVALLRRYSPGLFAFELGCMLDRWSAGFSSRGQALDGLAHKYDSEMLLRCFSSVTRSMRLGTPLAPTLAALAENARRSFASQVEERVMKAPVKMMFPIGMLILPSMLILVLGPVLLDLIIS